MEFMKNSSSLNTDDNTKLLFFENFKLDKSQYNIEEIFFQKPVLLQQIRILKSESNPHPKIKSQLSITQSQPIHNFEIFGRNMKKPSDKFETILENSTININLAQTDCIFPFFKEFITNHLIIRGNWERITMCIYGLPVSPTEAHKLLEQAKSDVSLESLIKMEEAENPENSNFTKEEIDLLNNYKVDQLISPYIKCELMDDFRKAYFITPPNLSMVEKTRTGYIYYEKELNFCIQCLNNFYLFDPKLCKGKKLTVNSQGYLYLSVMEEANTNIEELNIINYQSLCKKLIDLITKLIANNSCFLENECVFNKDNYQIYLKFPEMLIDIIINGLLGKLYGFIEIRYALKLLKLVSNSAHLTEVFLEKNGMELLYSLLLGRENTYFFNNNSPIANLFYSSNPNNQSNSSIIKIGVLENIYKLITHKTAFNRFIENNEKNKNNQMYFMIKDILKESEKENMQNVNNLNLNPNSNISANNTFDCIPNQGSNNMNGKESKGNNKDKNDENPKEEDNKKREKEKKSKKSKKKSKKDRRISRSRSRSKSRSISKSKSRTFSRSKQSVESEHSQRKKPKITLNNLSTINANNLNNSSNAAVNINPFNSSLTINSNTNTNTNTILKNGYQILLTLLTQKKNNIIFNMIQKILNKIANDHNTLNLYSEKITYYLHKIIEGIEKYDIAYKMNFPRDNDCSYSEDYPYKQFWVDYLKLGRRMFNKSEVINEKSFINHEKNSSNKVSEFKIITNDLSIIFEEFELIENLIELMTNHNIQRLNSYTENCILIKTIFMEILLSKGGINFFSKNFDITMILRNYLNKSTESVVNDTLFTTFIQEENFFTFTLNKDINFGEKSEAIKNLYQKTKESSLNKVLININENHLLENEFIIKANLLQLRHILELSFLFLSKLDYFINFKQEESDFIDKSLEILIIISQRITKSNIAKQAFLSVFQNEYYIEQFILLIKFFTEEDSTEFEAHITLLSEILFEVFNENNRCADEILYLYGPQFYDCLLELKNKMNHIYDSNEIDPINKNIFSSLESLISLLKPAKLLFEEKNIDSIINCLNESVYNNVQKYNLNVKCINDENVKESIRDYVKAMKMNIINHENSDIDYLDTIKSRGSLINEIFVAVKLVNLSIRINPLLLIDCVRRHIHLTIRYLIVNTVNSLKALLSTSVILQGEAKNDCEKYKKIKEYSILLSNLYEILAILLKNLLSSHVDNYRDSSIIDQTINLIIILTNYLYENFTVYSVNNSFKESNFNNSNNDLNNTNSSNNNFSNPNFSFEDNNSNLNIIEYLQNLLLNALNTFKEMCKFNTSIKLSFEKILEKVAEKPSNKGPMIYILNFMMNVVSNEYTIETFIENFRKTQKKMLVDVYNDIEYNIKANPVRLCNLFEEKNFIKYVIEIGTSCENEWIVENAAKFLLAMQRCYVTKSKENLYQEISEALISSLNTTFNKISKIECLTILNEKEIENNLPNLDSLFKHLNFILYFLKSEYKFIYIFYDLTNRYLIIYNYFKNYLQLMDLYTHENESQIMKNLKNLNLDIMLLLLESFNILCDSEQGYYKYIKEDSQSTQPQSNSSNTTTSLPSNFNLSLNNPNQNINYYYSNFVEELPNKEQILSIVKNTKLLLEFILSSVEKETNNNNIENEIQILDYKNISNTNRANLNILNGFKCSIYLDKALLIANKILRIYLNLSRNFYGQSIILHSDFEVNGMIYANNLKPNPSLNLNYMQNFILNKLKNLDLNSNKISINFLEITHNYLMIVLLSFYDMLYFEYSSNNFDNTNNQISSNTLKLNNIFTSDFISDLTKIKCVVTDTHLFSLLNSISGMEISKENIFEASKSIQEMFINFNTYLDNISNKYYQTNNELYNEFNLQNENYNNNVFISNTANENNFENMNGFVNKNKENINLSMQIDNLDNTKSAEFDYSNLVGETNQFPSNFEEINTEMNNLDSNKDSKQKDEMTNLIDTDMNTNTNINVCNSNNLNTPNNNNFFEVLEGNSNPNFQTIINRQKKIYVIQNILDKLNLIKRNNSLIIRLLTVNSSQNAFVFLDLIDSDSLNKPFKLPNTRKIYEKCEMINKYYEFIQTQSLDYNLAIPIQSQQNISQPQILNPLLNSMNNPSNLGNNSPTNASTAPSNIISGANIINNNSINNNQNIQGTTNTINTQNQINSQSMLTNKLSELGFARHQITEFEKLLNWKKYRIYLSKLDNLLVRRDIFDLDTCLKILPEEKLLKHLNNIDFSLLVNTNFMNRRFTYVNSDSFEQFCILMSNENSIIEKYTNISYSVTKNILNKKLLLADIIEYEGEELYELWIKRSSNLSCYKYEFEFFKIASGKNLNINLIKHGSGIKSIGVLSIAKNSNSKKKKISSKINLFVYKPNFEKYAKQMIIYHPTPMAAPLRENRQPSIVSGRNISTHLDALKPDQAVVTPHYTEAINKESNSSNLNDQIQNSNISAITNQAIAGSSNMPSSVNNQINSSNQNVGSFNPANKLQTQGLSHVSAFNTDNLASNNLHNQILPSQSNIIINPSLIPHFDKKEEDNKIIDLTVDSNTESYSNPILTLGSNMINTNNSQNPSNFNSTNSNMMMNNTNNQNFFNSASNMNMQNNSNSLNMNTNLRQNSGNFSAQNNLNLNIPNNSVNQPMFGGTNNMANQQNTNQQSNQNFNNFSNQNIQNPSLNIGIDKSLKMQPQQQIQQQNQRILNPNMPGHNPNMQNNLNFANINQNLNQPMGIPNQNIGHHMPQHPQNPNNLNVMGLNKNNMPPNTHNMNYGMNSNINNFHNPQIPNQQGNMGNMVNQGQNNQGYPFNMYQGNFNQNMNPNMNPNINNPNNMNLNQQNFQRGINPNLNNPNINMNNMNPNMNKPNIPFNNQTNPNMQFNQNNPNMQFNQFQHNMPPNSSSQMQGNNSMMQPNGQLTRNAQMQNIPNLNMSQQQQNQLNNNSSNQMANMQNINTGTVNNSNNNNPTLSNMSTLYQLAKKIIDQKQIGQSQHQGGQNMQNVLSGMMNHQESSQNIGSEGNNNTSNSLLSIAQKTANQPEGLKDPRIRKKK